MNLKYLIGCILFAPTLPIMYLQGKRIKKKIPRLPEAKDPNGFCAIPGSKKTLSLISIGESTIAGVGVETHQEGFNGTFARELSRFLDVNISWRVYARSGYNASKVNERLIPKIQETNPDFILIGLGGNDAFELSGPKKWRADMSDLVRNLEGKFPEAFLLFTCMPPIKEFPAFTPLIKMTIGNLVELLGKELAELSKQHDRVFYDDRILTLRKWNDRFQISAEATDYFSDGVHPSKLAYQSWAKDMAERVVKDGGVKSFTAEKIK